MLFLQEAQISRNIVLAMLINICYNLSNIKDYVLCKNKTLKNWLLKTKN